MMFFPVFRLLTGPLPPLRLAARFLAAVILPPLLFFIVRSPPFAESTRIGAGLAVQMKTLRAVIPSTTSCEIFSAAISEEAPVSRRVRFGCSFSSFGAGSDLTQAGKFGRRADRSGK